MIHIILYSYFFFERGGRLLNREFSKATHIQWEFCWSQGLNERLLLIKTNFSKRSDFVLIIEQVFIKKKNLLKNWWGLDWW